MEKSHFYCVKYNYGVLISIWKNSSRKVLYTLEWLVDLTCRSPWLIFPSFSPQRPEATFSFYIMLAFSRTGYSYTYWGQGITFPKHSGNTVSHPNTPLGPCNCPSILTMSRLVMHLQALEWAEMMLHNLWGQVIFPSEFRYSHQSSGLPWEPSNCLGWPCWEEAQCHHIRHIGTSRIFVGELTAIVAPAYPIQPLPTAA